MNFHFLKMLNNRNVFGIRFLPYLFVTGSFVGSSIYIIDYIDKIDNTDTDNIYNKDQLIDIYRFTNN